MSILSQVNQLTKLPNRFLQGGFQPMGAVSRLPRENTSKEIMSSILAHAKDNSEIATFAAGMKGLNPKYLGLAQDIIDLSSTHEMLAQNINLKEVVADGKSIMGIILDRLPEISKKNPAALDLTEAVINNTDLTNAKYFLCKLFSFNLENMGKLSEQMKAAKEVVPEIAKDTLDGGYTMSFSKNEEFFKYIQTLCSGDTKPQNIKFIKQIVDMMQKVCKKSQPTIDLGELRTGDTKTIRENMEVLPYLLENAEAQGKSVDISGFLTKNVNLN